MAAHRHAQGRFVRYPPTNRKIDIHEIGILRLANGKIVEGWFMADEAGLLRQLGAALPPRKDSRPIVPEPSTAGEDPDVVLKRLKSGPTASQEDRNKLIVAGSKTVPPTERRSSPRLSPEAFRLPAPARLRRAKNLAKFNITHAFPDRRDRIDTLLAKVRRSGCSSS